MLKQLIFLLSSSTSLRQFPLLRQFLQLYVTATCAHFGLLAGFVIAIEFIQQFFFLVLKDPLSLSANLATHSLSKVFFTFFGLPLANENGQDRSFFLEDIRTLITAREIACQTKQGY